MGLQYLQLEDLFRLNV